MMHLTFWKTTSRISKWNRAVEMETLMNRNREKIAIQVRWMLRKDMRDVLEIERTSFEDAWSQDDFSRCLRTRNCIGMVAEHAGRVAGFMVYELCGKKLQLLNIAVAVGIRRWSVGQAMINKLKRQVRDQRRSRITLAVRETNLDAQLFFKVQGFRAVAVLRGFYKDLDEDAYTFVFRDSDR